MSELIDGMPSAGPPATPETLSYYGAVQRPSFTEFLGAQAREGWWGSVAGQATAWARTKSSPNDQPLTEEQWKASPNYRPEVDFHPGMTAGEAQTRTDIVDENTYRRNLAARRQPGFWGSVAGFGAGLAGAALSPESLLPFGEAAELARATLGARMLMGARVGALQTAALALPLAASQSQFGDDVSASDVLLNIGFGTVLGAGLGGLGHLAATRMKAGEPLPAEVPLPKASLLQEAADAIFTGGEQLKLGEDLNLGNHPIADTLDTMRAETNARAVEARRADTLYEDAVRIATEEKPSPSRLQRELGLDYPAVEALVRRMENEGIISPPDAVGERRILATPDELAARRVARESALTEPLAREAPLLAAGDVPWRDSDVRARLIGSREQVAAQDAAGTAAARAQQPSPQRAPLPPLDRRSAPPREIPPTITAKEIEESVEAQLVDAKLQQMKASGTLGPETVRSIDESAAAAARARNYEPAAQAAVNCVMAA